MQFTLSRLLGFRIRRASLNVLIVSLNNIFLLLFFNKSLCCHPGVRLSSQHIAMTLLIRDYEEMLKNVTSHMYSTVGC